MPGFLSRRMDNFSDTLAVMGMPSAVDPSRADFSGMHGLVAPHEEALFVSGVIHAAAIDVDEAGTEATAATAIVMDCAATPSWRRRPPPVPIFRADRPFLFVIRHRGTGTILFTGRVADPTAED